MSMSTVTYGPHAKQAVDVYAPPGGPNANGGPHPVVVFFHGGVWQFGDRSEYATLGRDLARHGFVAFVASYRLAPQHTWPAQLDDARAVIDVALKEAPRHGGDPRRLLVMGHSAGAQLAALLVQQGDERIRALALFSGVFDLELPLDEAQRDGGYASFIAPVFARSQLAGASPLRAAARLDVPVLLVTSERDYRAMHAQTVKMHEHLVARKERVQLVELARVDHFGMVASLDEALARTLRALMPAVP